jgi:hypothetical protein
MADDAMPHDPTPNREPEYGPSGYLPPRAAKRARKIMLREQMGLGWPLAALAAAAVIAVAGAVFLSMWSSPPPAPWMPAGPLSAVDPGEAVALDAAGGVLVVRAGGRLGAFTAPVSEVTYCAKSGHLESPDGLVWSLDGRLLGGSGDSLRRLPVQAFEGVVYVDPTRGDRPPPRPGLARPACS